MADEQKPSKQAFDAEWENRANWKAGLFYHAPQDPRAWVPKRSTLGRRRFGVTPNLAHPAARRYLFIMLGVFAALFVLLYALQKAGIIH